ncbi:hypothetical protein JCM1840_002217 [Sporobolomyces johnsonii]
MFAKHMKGLKRPSLTATAHPAKKDKMQEGPGEPEQGFQGLSDILRINLDDSLTFDMDNNLCVKIPEWADKPNPVMLWQVVSQHAGGRTNVYSASPMSIDPDDYPLTSQISRQVPGTTGPSMLSLHLAMYSICGNMYQDVDTLGSWKTALMTMRTAREWAKQGKMHTVNCSTGKVEAMTPSAGYTNGVYLAERDDPAASTDQHPCIVVCSRQQKDCGA